MLWIGGPPGAGKTTIASRLARRHGLRLYSSDTRTWEHRDRAIRSGSAAAIRWEALTPEERWAAPPAELLELSLHRERGPMIVDDLLTLPRSPLVVAEGSTLPAAAVRERSHAVWLTQCAASSASAATVSASSRSRLASESPPPRPCSRRHTAEQGQSRSALPCGDGSGS